MVTCKHTQMKSLEIWEPRWHDRKVLLATYKVGEHNKVIFSKSKSLEGAFYISGKTAKRYKKEPNGAISCYAVPLDKFEPLELKERCEHSD